MKALLETGNLTFFRSHVAGFQWFDGQPGRTGPRPTNPNDYNPLEHADIPSIPARLILIFGGGGVYDVRGADAEALRAQLSDLAST